MNIFFWKNDFSQRKFSFLSDIKNAQVAKGNNIKKATPSMPVEVLGFDANPLAGDDFVVVDNENTARKIAEYRFNKKQIQKNKVVKTNVEEMFEQISAGESVTLPVIIKADVQGSAEAIENSITKLST